MGLSSDLISEFVKITNDKNTEEKKESIVYGTTVEHNGKKYVKIDGSDLLTPITSTADAQSGERVTVMIKNHTATVTGNISSPAARSADVKGMGSDYQNLSDKIDEFEIIVANKVDTEALNAVSGRIDYLVSDNTVIRQSLTAAQADISDLQADNATVKEKLTAAEADITELKTDKLDTRVADVTYATIENLDAVNADVHNLESTYAAFESTTTTKLTAQDATISDLQTKKLDVDTADITYAKISELEAATADITNLEATFGDFEVSTNNKLAANEASIAALQANKLSASDIEGKYANIDFSNIGKAAMQYFYSESGLIRNVVVGDATITGQLVGVTISGDLIEGNTVVAEKLVIKGNDGLYYKLNTDGVTTEAEQTDYNSLNGRVIKAKSITATKISVDDLVAFDATIGGFNITDSAIYSGVKESVDNTTSGLYMDKEGQLALGDSGSFIKYYKDQNGDYHLEISAQSVLMSTTISSEEPQVKTIEQVIEELSETATTTASDLTNYMSSTNAELESLQGQIDGSITTWFYEYEPTTSNAPASEWTTTDLKNEHLKDLFYNTLTGYCYRWQLISGVYSWDLVKDVDITKAIADAAAAQATANNKKRVFVSTPSVPYDVGDLWVQGSSGDILKCQTARTSSQSYISTDWVKASKYTDDTAANKAQSDVNALTTRVSSAETEISQNKEAIALRATKTEVAESLSGYYTKEQADAALTVKANEITSNVSSTYATKTALNTTNANVTAAQNAADKAQQSIDSLDIGGRNYILNSNVWKLNGSTANGITQTIENGVKKIVSVSGNGNWNSFSRDNVIEANFKDGDTFTFAVEIKSDDSTTLPSIYFKSGLGYYSMKGTISTDYSWCYYTGTWKDANNISFHLGWQNAIGTYYLRRIMFIKGNKLLDWSPAPEDIEADISAAQEAADNAQAEVDAIEVRVTNAETNISQNSDDILLRATKTEVATAKSEAISTAASDATTKADNALASAKTYADAQIKVSADNITSTVNSVKTTAEAANSYVTNATNNYGYQYKKTITINGDSSTYYPVLILGGDQNVMREIMVTRGYGDKAPSDWNGHPTAKGISLLLKIKCNFGGWGGANYSWVIHELEECYGNVFAGASNVMANMGFVIFLRGGGETGATYYLYSDQQLDRGYMNGYSVRICYEQEQIGWSGGTEDNPTYTWNAPAPRTLTDSVKEGIASKKYIDVATSAQNGVNDLTARMTSAETKIQQNTDAIELRATKTELSTVSTAAENAQSTADTANSTANANKTNLANNYYTKTQTDAKIKVESDKISSAVSRISANETAISTLEQTADGLEVRLDTTDANVTTAQNTANTANTTANSVKTDLANNYTKKSLPDTRNDNQAPSWYFENYPKQIITEFKYCSKIGLTGVGTYCTLQTIVPWNDSSGGYPKQTAKVEGTGKEFWRVGTSATVWSDWVDPYGSSLNAAKTATNYLSFSSSGLVVGDMTADTLGENVLIDSNSVDIRNGTTTLASFGASTIYLGKNNNTSVINLCNGSATMRVVDDKDFKIYTDKRLVMSAYDSMLLDCYRDSTHMTRIAIQSSDPDVSSVVGGVSFTIYQDSVENTFTMLNDDIELKVTDGTNETRMNIDPSIFKIYAASRIRLNSKTSLQIGESSSYSAALTLGHTYNRGKSINCYWSDGEVHDLISNSSNGQSSYFGPANITINDSSNMVSTTNIRGKYVRLYNHTGGGVYLGSSGSTAVTSDRNLKKDIVDIDSKYMDFFDRLRPITYKYNCPENNGHRDHVGFIAQEVEEALIASGLTTEQFAGLVIERDVTLNHNYDSSLSDEENAANELHYDTLYELRYEEFISLLVKKVQDLQAQIDELRTS